MSWVAVAIAGSGAISAGGSIIGSMMQSNASGNAIDAIKQMYSSGLGQQSQYVQQAIGSLLPQAKEAVSPFISAGKDVIPTLTKLLTPGADMTSTLEQIPGFKFAQEYGQKAITNQATSRGLSGNVLSAGANYATGAASQTYQGIVDALSKVFQTGSGAGNTLANIIGSLGSSITGAGNAALGGATNFGNMLSGAITGKGAAEASGVLGASNAAAGTANTFGNIGMINALTGKNLLGGPQSYNPAGQPVSLGAWGQSSYFQPGGYAGG